ncbi:uncharacterized protein [Rutidosis leptorrhynchoides]|uniref:uncharacterized protein n=1 Tax=Rutidosis leptorrhynchoides TaxID=125765 RepID=UPI003A99A646
MFFGGDLNGHIGASTEGYAGAHGGFGYGVRNEEGCSILDFAIAHDLVIANSFFRKTEAHLATFYSGGRSTQINYLLLRKEIQRRTNMSVRAILPRILWKNLSGDKAESFRAKVVERVDEMYNASRESWWISEEVQAKVTVKHVRFRELITLRDGPLVDRTRAEERYKEAKREAKKAVARAKDKAYEELYKRLDSKEGANDIFKIAKARERRRRDMDNIKFIKDEAGKSIVKEDGIRKRWEEYFSPLFIAGRSERNDERDDTSIEEYQNNCPYSMIKENEVREALRRWEEINA